MGGLRGFCFCFFCHLATQRHKPAMQQQNPTTQPTTMPMITGMASFRFFLLSHHVVGAAVGASVAATTVDVN